MSEDLALETLTEGMATAVPAVDAVTAGQYEDGLGSETEERQIDLLFGHLRETDDRYRGVEREVPYPDGSGRCDLVLPTGTPVEVELIRYWRANGDPEPTMYTHVFSPFHRNTLLNDVDRLRGSGFERPHGLLGLFYTRSEDDPEPVESLSERYTAEEIAERVVRDLEYWHDADAKVCGMSRFDGLRHRVHGRGAVVSWLIG
jgi:hypothetical protein